MANKKGAANVEFILAFILFIGFLMAALYFFNPVRDLESLEASKNYVLNEIIRRSSVELDSYSIIISADNDITRIEVEIPGVESYKNARVEDYYGNGLDAERIGDKVCFRRENNEDFVVIRFSEDFEKGNLPCTGAGAGYEIASSISGKMISVKKIHELNISYHADYEALKESLDIPEGVDFSFSLELADGYLISAGRKIPLRAEVYAETKIKEVLKEDGTSGFAYLKVSAW